ncbi:MAG: hypothetical protein DCO96_05460 [Fluviicola sp. XM-24bin1]|nr:MAG: hypothetical protein DCO96_05460 [Fluviicola sp. XM-24bin1]
MKFIATLIIIGCAWLSHAQDAKPTIAVAVPHVMELDVTPDIAAKYIQLELIKMDKYSVYDEFDMAEVIKDSNEFTENCYGISCLTRMGRKLNVDYIICGSFDGLANKIAISLKWIDVKKGELHLSMVREFDNQEEEIQRMVEVLLKEMHQVPVDGDLVSRLEFKNELITSNNVGRINNSGPRIGYAYLLGDMNEFALRSRTNGGLEIIPAVSMIGYQLEGQYVGTENFSALVEGIVNFSGLEQGTFIPSITILNGFRFGKSGWEFAFGPGFNLKRTAKGFFDSENYFGEGSNYYFSESDWNEYALNRYGGDTTYQDQWGDYTHPSPSDVSGLDYGFVDCYDRRGQVKISTTWIFAFGKTFNAGALNIPVNVFYSSSRGGGMVGLSVGFNVQKSKRRIN